MQNQLAEERKVPGCPIASVDPARSLGEWRGELGRHLSDEELVLPIVMPAEPVDAMVAARHAA